jgi:hypothetical protein
VDANSLWARGGERVGMRADLISYGLYHSLLESHETLTNLQAWSKLKLGIALQSSFIAEAALELIEHFKKIDEVHFLIRAVQNEFGNANSLQPLYNVLTYAQVRIAASGTKDVEHIFSRLTINPNVRDRVLFIPDLRIADVHSEFARLESSIEKCSAYVFAVGRLGDRGLHRSLSTGSSKNVKYASKKTRCEEEFECMCLQGVPGYLLLPSVLGNNAEVDKNPRLGRVMNIQAQRWPPNHVIHYEMNDDLVDLACQFQNLLYQLQSRHSSLIKKLRGEAWGTRALPKVFIGYSHIDSEWFDRVRSHLSMLLGQVQLSIWDGRTVDPGDVWVEHIRHAIQSSQIVVLLVSAEFLGDPFIQDVILKTVRESYSGGGLFVVAVMVDQCRSECLNQNRIGCISTNDSLLMRSWMEAM